MKLKLLTFNTLGTPIFASNIAGRYRKISEMLNASDIDVVCLQELFSHYNRFWFDRGLTNFPYKVYKPFSLGLYGGLAIYSKHPLNFEYFQVYTYPKGIFVPPYTRLARSGILVSKFTNIPLLLATTHLASDVIHNVTPANRFYKLINNQLQQAADLFNELSEKNNIILAGDFNISSKSTLYENFIKKTQAQDIFRGDTKPSYAPDRIRYIYPAKTSDRIDYMFYKGKLKLKIEKAELMFADKVKLLGGMETYPSDHLGLSATLQLI